MLLSVSLLGRQQRFKLGGEVSLETGDHLSRNFGRKRFRQRKWGYSGMTATNMGTQFESFKKLPTDRAAQFGNGNHIAIQILVKYE